MLIQRFSKPVTPGVKDVVRKPKPPALPAVDKALDKALDDFVADKPPSIMKDER